ncbi:MAG: phosphatase PAP2 family protein [Alphaproteobacteria bacterium]
MPIFFFLFLAVLALPIIWPQVDLLASGVFYRPGEGFFLADNPVFVALHWLAYDGARVLGVAFAVFAAAAYYQHRKSGKKENLLLGLDDKAWLFLLLALLIGPGLVANVGLKDHWGRARPREVVEMGGTQAFSPVYVPQFHNAHSNGSFVSGDGAFGFFLPVFAYVVPRRASRRVFWGCMIAGGLFGFARLAMGAHFLSDLVYAAFFVMAAAAGVHTAMYGLRETIARWRGWFRAPVL